MKDLSSTFMPLDELRELLATSRMLDHNKLALRRVLCEGWSVTSAAEKIGVSPSVIHRACEALLLRRTIPGVSLGPDSAFEAWYLKRCEKVPPLTTESGMRLTQWAYAKALRADLEAFCPGVVNHTRFGILMRLKGHPASQYAGKVRYPHVRLIGSAQAPVGSKVKGSGVELYNGHALRRPDGGRWTDPATGLEIPDDQIRKFFDDMDAAESVAPVRDAKTGRVIGTRLALGMVKGRSVRAGDL